VHEVSASSIIDMPRSAAWDKLRDISRAHHYVPGIVRTEVVSKQPEGVGASRYVYRSEKSYIQETVTEWRDGEGFRIRLHRGENPAPPFREAWFDYQLNDHGTRQTRLTTRMGYEMPWGALGRFLGKRMTGVVEKTIADVAYSMTLYYETGNPTTPAALRKYKASALR
jgi:ribosome-associated toxin RatA of RatAB toxin-antitoxin module